MGKNRLVGYSLGLLSLLSIGLALYMTFVFAPMEKTMGQVQRIFYFHLPLAWIGFLAFLVVFLSGIMYLITRSVKWDTVALSSAEIGVMFSTLVLITGSIWAKKAWNTWWTWEPRLTTMLILWLTYLGYLLVRRAVDEAGKRASVAAVVGIVGFVNVPMVFISIRWWRSMHPIILTRTGMSIAPPMLATLLVSLGAFTLLYFYLLFLRVNLGLAEDAVEEIRARVQ
ncbi:MAG TPA: cytochrome C assembly protein [bacterium]|nr:cytochrome C assembly protein [bacterium]